MTPITEQQLADADNLAVEAEEKRLAAERAFAVSRTNPGAERALIEAQLAASHAAAVARTLRYDYEAQQAAREARVAAEKAVTKTMAATVKQLAKTREDAVQAVIDAEAAMTRAVAVIGEHDLAVRAASADLRARGLTADDGEAMGGARGGVAHLGGEVWFPVDGPSMLQHALAAVVALTYPRHPVGRTPRLLGGAGAAAGRDALKGRPKGNERVRHLAETAGLPNAPDFTAHGLRAGGPTEAAKAGHPVSFIADHGRWSKNSPQVLEYIRPVDKWRDNPMRGIGL